MEKTIFYVSDCCYCEAYEDTQVCPSCGEHCEVLTDDSLVSDYIPGHDDGEW